jgi:splicing factor 3B subunit 3
MMALSSRSWLLHNLDNKYHTDPLTYDGLDGVADISSEVIPHGFVGITGQTIRIFTLDSFSLGVGSRGNGSVFNQTSIPLLYTPRKFIRLPQTRDLIVIESDINEYNSTEAAEIEARVAANNSASSSAAAANAGEEEDDSDQRIPVRGPVPPAEGKWASAIQVIEGVSGTIKTSFELSENEAALSICTCRFSQYSEETFIVVGTVKDLRVTHRAFTSASIHVYRLLPDSSLQLLHKTEVEEIPHAMIEFQGKLLVGIGRCLRLYDMGKKKLLKKTENKSFPSFIVKLQAMGDRVYVGDLSQSIVFAKYRRHENTFAIFADDSLPR